MRLYFRNVLTLTNEGWETRHGQSYFCFQTSLSHIGCYWAHHSELPLSPWCRIKTKILVVCAEHVWWWWWISAHIMAHDVFRRSDFSVRCTLFVAEQQTTNWECDMVWHSIWGTDFCLPCLECSCCKLNYYASIWSAWGNMMLGVFIASCGRMWCLQTLWWCAPSEYDIHRVKTLTLLLCAGFWSW